MPRIQHKRGTSANLASVNPTPLAGELVWDSTENAIKIGDGSTAWTSLAYVTATPRTHTHSADAITSGTVAYARLPVGSTTSTVCAGDDARLTDARNPTAHKSTHATGGSDALTPSDIGAAPAASPAITGNATFEASSGVPVTITNTGTGNSFVVNDEASDASPFVISNNGNIGIGAAATTTSRLLLGGTVTGSGTNFVVLASPTAQSAVTTLYSCLSFPGVAADCSLTNLFHYGAQQGTYSGTVATQIGFWAHSGLTSATNNYGFRSDIASGTGRWNFFSNGTAQNYFAGNVGIGASRTSPASALDVNGVITVSATAGSAGSYLPSLTISGDSNTGFGQVSGQSDTASIFTAGHERVRVRSNGDLNLGGDASALFARLNVRGNSANTATIDGVTVESVAYWIASNGAGSLFSTFDTATGNAFVFSGTVNTSLGLGTRSNRSGTNQNHENLRIKPTGAVRFVPLSADPASGEAGDVYYNSASNALRYHNGSTFVGVAPAASPTFTGTTTFNGPVVEGRVVGGNTGTAKTIALTNGTLQDYTLTGNCTFTMPTATAGQSFTLMLRTGAGSYTATFTGVKWPGSTPVVTTTASRMDLFTFVSDGTNWYGNVVQGYTP